MARTLTSRVRRALDHDVSATVSIGTGVLAALAWSAVGASSYQRIIDTASRNHLLRETSIDSIHSFVVNAMMTIFFFAIGLELSRELRSGALTKASLAVPPVLGALGGMLVTALLSLIIGLATHSSALRRGWGVPMATDIALTLGVLALAGRRLPSQIRVFLITLAVADDAFSIIILALTGATNVRLTGLVALCLTVGLGIWISKSTKQIGWNLVLLAVLWACFVWANVEPPLAGVIGEMCIRDRANDTHKITLRAMRSRAERARGFCSISPALANRALALNTVTRDTAPQTHPNSTGHLQPPVAAS